MRWNCKFISCKNSSNILLLKTVQPFVQKHKYQKHQGNEEYVAKTAEIPDPAWLCILALQVLDYKIFTVSWFVKTSVNVRTVFKVPRCVAKPEQHNPLILCLVLGCLVEQTIISWAAHVPQPLFKVSVTSRNSIWDWSTPFPRNVILPH